MARWKAIGGAVGILLLSCGTLLASPPAAKKAAASKFIRLKRDADGKPVALETATLRLVPASGSGGLTVDLVGVVHIGDRGYYERLNKQLDQYDVVLYELVAPPGTRIPKGGKRSDNPVAIFQQVLKVLLDLDSQVERIDYTRKNFVHADLSPEQMAKAVRDRGDDGLTLFLSITADFLRQANLQQQHADKEPAAALPDLDLFSLFTDPAGPVKLKQFMAEQMARLEDSSGGLGPTLGTILISDRNQAAMKVFQKELAKGKKKIAVFYGAAHMPDFEKRLREDFGLKRAGEQWLTAWDIKVKEKGLEDLLDLLKLLDR